MLGVCTVALYVGGKLLFLVASPRDQVMWDLPSACFAMRWLVMRLCYVWPLRFYAKGVCTNRTNRTNKPFGNFKKSLFGLSFVS